MAVLDDRDVGLEVSRAVASRNGRFAKNQGKPGGKHQNMQDIAAVRVTGPVNSLETQNDGDFQDVMD